jgi:hypothetical protein
VKWFPTESSVMRRPAALGAWQAKKRLGKTTAK